MLIWHTLKNTEAPQTELIIAENEDHIYKLMQDFLYLITYNNAAVCAEIKQWVIDVIAE
jgi:hypothetical protein